MDVMGGGELERGKIRLKKIHRIERERRREGAKEID